MRAPLVVVLALVLAACATPGKVTPDIWHSLTPPQQQEASTVEAAIARLRTTCQAENPADPCTPPKMVLTRGGTIPQYQAASHTIFVPVWVLNGPHHTVIAHELGHAWWSDARGCSRERQVVCEQNANAHAVRVLVVGFGHSEALSVQMVRAWLVSGVRNDKPSLGHEDLCQELHNFEQRAGVAPPYPCQERQP